MDPFLLTYQLLDYHSDLIPNKVKFHKDLKRKERKFLKKDSRTKIRSTLRAETIKVLIFKDQEKLRMNVAISKLKSNTRKIKQDTKWTQSEDSKTKDLTSTLVDNPWISHVTVSTLTKQFSKIIKHPNPFNTTGGINNFYSNFVVCKSNIKVFNKNITILLSKTKCA